MKSLRTMVLCLGLGGLMLVGCGNDLVKKSEAFADQACKCKDAECATKVQAEFMKYLGDKKDAKGSESDKEKITKAFAKLTQCVSDITMKAAGGAAGEAPAGGMAPAGGEAPAGGAAPAGGEAPAGGAAPAGGEAPAGGAAPAGGEAPAGGAAPAGGN